MQREPVTSSKIKSVGYDPERKVLEVEFKNGGLYQYSGVDPQEHADLMAAPSIGKHFHAAIKGGGYECNCLRGGGPRE